MRSLQKMALGETARNIIMAVVYLVFFYMMISSAVEAADPVYKGIYIVIMVFFGAFGLLSEYLRQIYRRAIRILVMDCRPADAMEVLEKLERADILKGYRNAAVVFRTLALVDMNKPQQLLEYIEGPAKKVLEYSLDMKLVYYYNVFYGNLMLDNREAAAEIYPKLLNLYTNPGKGKKRRVSPIYSFDVIKGDYCLSQGQYAKAHREYEQAATVNMNNRELANYYLSRYAACRGIGRSGEAQKYLEQARGVAPCMPRVIDAERQ